MKINILQVDFDKKIDESEITNFRGAIIEKVGMEYDYFHNHNNSKETKERNSNYHYRYPLIQYRRSYGQPSILFIEDGIEHAQHFFKQRNWEINMNGRPMPISITKLEMDECTLQLSEDYHYYRLHRWMGLNSNNLEIYHTKETLVEKTKFLENVLAANLLGFASGIGWNIPERFTVQLTQSFREVERPFKGMNMLTFEIFFRTNLLLPKTVGIGKSSSVGFGILRRLKRPHNYHTQQNRINGK